LRKISNNLRKKEKQHTAGKFGGGGAEEHGVAMCREELTKALIPCCKWATSIH
jgi:hypothetical protein